MSITPEIVAPYRDPFEGMAEAYLPEDLKEFFPLAANIYNQNPLVQLATKKWAEYAVTDLEYDPDDKTTPALRKKYQDIFENKLRIRKALIQIGLDYVLFGNAFLSVMFPVSRRYGCPECNGTDSGDLDEYFSAGNITDLIYNGKEFKGTCPSCGKKVKFDTLDDYDKNSNNIALKTWAPVNIDILPNRWTDKEYYFWSPPDDMVQNVKDGEMRIIKDTPIEALEAIAQNKTVELNDVFHFKMISPSDVNSEWGKGVVLCAFKIVFYIAQLRHASEAIAFEHITPMRLIFPQGVEGLPPQSILMKKYKTFIEEEFELWRKDPNHICISPLPVGQEYLGGQGRAFLPTSELELANQELFLAFGLPQGLIQGQAPWAGNSISLRIVENAFLTYRDQLQEVIDWIQAQVQDYLGLESCEINMKEFKMLDDIQHKQMIINLAMSGKVPIRDMLELFDYDYDEVVEVLEDEAVTLARIQATAQAEMTKIQSKMQQDMEADYMAKMVEDGIQQSQNMMDSMLSMIKNFMRTGMSLDQSIAMVQSIQQQQAMHQQMQMQQQQAEQARSLFLADRMGKAQWSNVRAQREGTMYDIMGSISPQQANQQSGQTTDMTIQEYVMLTPEQKQSYLKSIYQKGPEYYEMFVDRLNSLGIPPNFPHPMADNQRGMNG